MDDNDYVLAFDHFYTNNHIQILKSLLPFMEGSASAMLPAVIKYMELQYTLRLVKRNDRPLCGGELSASSKSPENGMENTIEQIYNAVRRYLSPNEEKMFSQLLSAMQTMKNMREMQQMMELLQSLSPDSEAESAPGGLGSLGNLGNLGNLDNLNGLDISGLNELMQMFGKNDNKGV